VRGSLVFSFRGCVEVNARAPMGISETTEERVAGALRGRPPRVPPALAPVPRITLTRTEAAAALGMSLDSFKRHVQPELRLVRRGSIRLVPVAELTRWAIEAAERTI